MMTQFCRKCGAKLPDDSVFCHRCGTRIIEVEDVTTRITDASVVRIEPVKPAHTNAPHQQKQENNFTGFDYSILMCKQCGNFHVGRTVCDICGSMMVPTGMDVKYFAKNYHEQFDLTYQMLVDYRKANSNTETLAQHEAEVKRFKTNFTKLSYPPTEKKDKQCPRCGHRCSGSSYLGEFYTCSICGAWYDGHPYDYKVDKALINHKQILESTKFSFSSDKENYDSFVVGSIGESTYKATHSIAASFAAIALSSAAATALSYKKPKEVLMGLYYTFLRCLDKHEADLKENLSTENVNQLLEYLAMMFNVVRSGYYAGQQNAVDMFEKLLIDINYQARQTFKQ